MKTVAIIQARMGSTRLPGKVLAELAGEPMLVRVMNRVRRARRLDEVVVATTLSSDDEPVVDLGHERGWPVFRGSLEDVLDRYYQAAKEYGADYVVRITADCPLIDPEIIDMVVGRVLDRPELDYGSNTLPPRTSPRGLDVEVFRFEALERTWREATAPVCREHVTLYIYRNPDRFRIESFTDEKDLSSMRWTIDMPEDLAFVRRIYDHFGHDRFGWLRIVSLLRKNPDWLAINQHIQQKKVG